MVAPSLIPHEARRSGEDQSTRCAVAGPATARRRSDRGVGAGPHHEAVRDLTRARGAAVREQRARRQQVSALLLRLGLHYPGKTRGARRIWRGWPGRSWRISKQRIALEEMLHAVRQAGDRIARLEQAIHAAVPDWSLAPVGDRADGAARHRFIAATTLLAEIGDLTRFRTPRELMAWLGMVPREHSTGERIQARPDHQDRQPPGAQHPGGMRLELPPSAAGRQRQAGEGSRRRRPRCVTSPGRRSRG